MNPNPFDYNEIAESKQFEKNVIYDHSPDAIDGTQEFMKKSFSAANMNYGDLKVESFKPKPAPSHKPMSIHFNSKNEDIRGLNEGPLNLSARGCVNPTTVKPKFEGYKDINLNVDSQSTNLIDDVIQNKSQVSALDYKKLQDKLVQAEKSIKTLNDTKWTIIPVRDVIKRIVNGKPYSLDGYKSMTDKKGLLEEAVKSCDGNAITTVVIFLERTLSHKIFQYELRRCTVASNHYIQYLRRNEDWRKLEEFYRDMLRIEDAAVLRYEQAAQIKDIENRIMALNNWLNDYGRKTEVDELASYISEEIKLLKKQRQIEVEDKLKEASSQVMARYPRSNIELRPLLTTISYCALYHYDQGNNQFFPEEMKKEFKLNDKQYEWAVISPLATRHRLTDIHKLLTTTTTFFHKEVDVSYIGFENVIMVLHKAKVSQELIIKYAKLISNPETRIKYASKLLLHDIVIDSIVQLRDRHRLEEYRTKLGDTSRNYQQKINNILHSSTIKWR